MTFNMVPKFKVGQVLCIGDMEVLVTSIGPNPEENNNLSYTYKFLIHPEHPEYVGRSKQMPFELVDLVAELKPFHYHRIWTNINV